MANEDSDIFDPNLFLNLNYTEKTFTFEEHEIKLSLLPSSTTDYDLTGQVVWPAAHIMCRFIIQNQETLRGAKVLELGSGTGLCGILASRFSGSVTLTDHDPVVLKLLETNVTDLRNNASGNCSATKLFWGKEKHLSNFTPFGYDIVIGSDIVFWQSGIEPMLHTVNRLLSKREDAKLILSYKVRALNSERFLLERAVEFGFLIQNVPLESFMTEHEEYADCKLLILTRNLLS
eukprot:TRINITY_DN4141_c0_g1_i1.p1 TRINITY_DN4141_c0_g1~~TRINITY_DN4141_c0_g1_i1.p1  ORF type:complete len:252 (-),score=37.52 TRINITY_DN4141_c0_g1_i1:12-710(-)